MFYYTGWQALDRLLQLMLEVVRQEPTFAFHICSWMQPWHDQKVIRDITFPYRWERLIKEMDRHCIICAMFGRDRAGKTSAYLGAGEELLASQDTMWWDFGAPLWSWDTLRDTNWAYSFILLFRNLLQLLKQLERAASGIQWSTESCPSPYDSKPLSLGDSDLGTSFY